MSAVEDFRRYFAECPLVAIIRGVTPAEAEGIASALYDGGIRIIEVPLNSPQPLESIRIIAERFGDRTLVGAGTVLDPEEVLKVRDAMGRLIVSPNTNTAVNAASGPMTMIGECCFHHARADARRRLGRRTRSSKESRATPPLCGGTGHRTVKRVSTSAR